VDPFANAYQQANDRVTAGDEGLPSVMGERSRARLAYTKARFQRDAAAVYYDSVLDGGTELTRPAWDAFQAAQAAMDAAADRLNVACEVIIDILRR
jgi:uncharacterized protein YukE